MAPRFFSLSAVTRRLTELLEPALSAMFWVRAEISSGTERGGAFYCDLVESDAQGRVRAQLRCTIWPLELSRMRAKFAAAGLALELADGSVGSEIRRRGIEANRLHRGDEHPHCLGELFDRSFMIARLVQLIALVAQGLH